MMKYLRLRKLLTGIIFIGIGVGYLGDQLNWWDFTIFFPGSWAFLIIIPMIYDMIGTGFRFTNLVIAGVASYYVVSVNDLTAYPLTFPLVMAICCICVGIRLLFNRKRRTWDHEYKFYECED